MSRHIDELLSRTLVVVAHPDDECIGAGALLQRMRDSTIVFCTDGGPRDDYFWKQYGSREKYVAVRRKEAERAAGVVKVKDLRFLSIVDQELYLNLEAAARELEAVARHVRPAAILTLAYEGGHPDHDCCAFLGYLLGTRLRIPVWEMPIYHRTSQGARAQQFLGPGPAEERLRITANELAEKRKMLACYISQENVLESFDLSIEVFRPQAQYDFARPPATDVINYEFWQWQMTAAAVSRAFAEFGKRQN